MKRNCASCRGQIAKSSYVYSQVPGYIGCTIEHKKTGETIQGQQLSQRDNYNHGSYKNRASPVWCKHTKKISDSVQTQFRDSKGVHHKAMFLNDVHVGTLRLSDQDWLWKKAGVCGVFYSWC